MTLIKMFAITVTLLFWVVKDHPSLFFFFFSYMCQFSSIFFHQHKPQSLFYLKVMWIHLKKVLVKDILTLSKTDRNIFLNSFYISDVVTVCISMSIPHCIFSPSCHLELHSNMMCFVCLTLDHCLLPWGQVTSSLWSVLCSFLCLSMPWDCSPTTHSLCLTYVDVEPSSYSICFMSCLCWSSLSVYRPGSNCICKLYQTEGGYRL